MADNKPEEKPAEKPPKKLHTEEETEEKIPHPYYELYRHCLLRGANTGSLLALLLGPPILYARGTRQPREILYRTARASIYGVVSRYVYSDCKKTDHA